jgi:hypothetical protein
MRDSHTRDVSRLTYNLLSDVRLWQRTSSSVNMKDRREQRRIYTLYKFDTVSSGAGEKAKLIYVNWSTRHHSWYVHWAHNKRTHKWITSFPSKLLPQELDHSLESIGRCNPVEVLLHDWSISDSFEADNNWSLEHQSLWSALTVPWTILRTVTFRCRILLLICVQRL